MTTWKPYLEAREQEPPAARQALGPPGPQDVERHHEGLAVQNNEGQMRQIEGHAVQCTNVEIGGDASAAHAPVPLNQETSDSVGLPWLGIGIDINVGERGNKVDDEADTECISEAIMTSATNHVELNFVAVDNKPSSVTLISEGSEFKKNNISENGNQEMYMSS